MSATNNENNNYNVKLINEAQGLNTTIKVRGNEYISFAAELQGVKLPTSCNAGACVTCTAKLVKGDVEHEHVFLKPHELKAKFILTCDAHPRSDCEILTHQEDALLGI
ncbi:MAG: 2Fe-2S iron-sulfur cluster binding domain-containing protein [Moorea sp. SIO2B7]|nr:2Fe-2S iron-sulfur cluster binding domain-containing protein [Moorena sp. SIO2B7]